ncbi:hypothetical protein GCM10011318_16210 [Phaeocystidibacter marisrubri]|uniref:Response regulator transcription factor n=2 Tax=Phaeocystidibacter marisrubri TaxID=1577780 RepID=A0A6L3ZK11_9FLAO|nr:response regulator transcription factor [Phaeocystidibacter marisrubri]GGH72339.1 hypothetical protein GCM10011318_16210 [Phaeocystidibacter marisrubri]
MGMMYAKSLRILIVEDERIVAESIKGMLLDLGHFPVGIANSTAKAEEWIYTGGFDLAMLDVNLKSGEEGIHIAKLLYEKQIPFFFLTSYSDSSTLQKAKAVRPGAYVVKPFTEKDLFVAIEMTTMDLHAESMPSIVVRKGNAYSRVNVDEIRFVKAENIYTELHTADKTWLKRSSLKVLLEELEDSNFLQTHRSYAVNLNHVTGWSSKSLSVGEVEIPVSRRHWDDIKHILEDRFPK